MTRMFLDGIANELDYFKRLGELKRAASFIPMLTLVGFVEWARYKDVWKDT
jgi:hypothetical protein